MSDSPPDALAKANARLVTYQRRLLAVPGLWAAGIATLMALGPGLEYQPVVVLPIAGAVAALSFIPAWRMWRDRVVSSEAMTLVGVQAQQEKLRKLKEDLAAVPTSPEDERAQATRQLVARIRELAEGDPAVLKVAESAEQELSTALADVSMFQEALAADQAAAPGELPNERLASALQVRELEVDELVRAIRDLHAALSLKDDSAHEVLTGLRSVLNRADAEIEVKALGQMERARRSAASRVSES